MGKGAIAGTAVAAAAMVALAAGPVHGGESGRPRADAIGLTFDDGPDPVWTPVILDILEDRGAVATFFVLGWKVDAHPELARDIVERGHSIQVHGYHHNLYTAFTDAQVESNLRRAIGAIYRATGLRPSCFRAPRGLSNARVDAIASSLGLTVVGWDFNTADYALQSVPAITARTMQAVPGQSILAHDIWGFLWQHSLPQVLDEFAGRGYGYDSVCANHGPFGDRIPGMVRRGVFII